MFGGVFGGGFEGGASEALRGVSFSVYVYA